MLEAAIEPRQRGETRDKQPEINPQKLLLEVINKIRTNQGKILEAMKRGNIDPKKTGRRWGIYLKPGTENNLYIDSYPGYKVGHGDSKQLGHALNTFHRAAELTLYDVEHGTLSPEMASRLKLAALIHDWGELVDGDKNLTIKTKADAAKEIESFEKILPLILPANSPEAKYLHDLYIKVTSHEADKVSPHESGKANEARYFSMIEVLGYHDGALNIFLEHKNAPPSEQYADWRAICASIFAVHLEEVKGFLAESKSFRQAFKSRRNQLKEMFEIISSNPDQTTLNRDKGGATPEQWERIKAGWQEILDSLEHDDPNKTKE